MSRTAFVSYFVGKQTTWVFVLHPDRSEPFAEDTGVSGDHLHACAQRLLLDCNGLDPVRRAPEQEALVERALALAPAARRMSRQWPKHVGPDPRRLRESGYALTYLDELSEKLLPAVVRPVLEDCEVLCISAHGPLHSLPLHALRWSDGGYLGERFGICYVPGAGVLRHCQDRNRARRATPSHRPSSGLVAWVDMLGTQSFEADAALLGSLAEIEILAGSQEAIKPRVLQALSRTEVIHLACHGLFASDQGWRHPLQSGILLADGHRSRLESERLRTSPEEFRDCLLTAAEIFGLSLNADLVTLRACSTGRAQVTAGDDLLGLSRAWLYAGTPSLLVSLWNVNTESSQRLLRVFYQRWLEAGEPKWQALQTAQRVLLQDVDNLQYHHPYHWAPFVLIGDWA